MPGGNVIPSNLSIDPRVRPLVESWMGKQLCKEPPQEEDEDCCGSSSFTFSGYASGIGDSWWVQRGKIRFYFGVDDDNEPYTREDVIN